MYLLFLRTTCINLGFFFMAKTILTLGILMKIWYMKVLLEAEKCILIQNRILYNWIVSRKLNMSICIRTYWRQTIGHKRGHHIVLSGLSELCIMGSFYLFIFHFKCFFHWFLFWHILSTYVPIHPKFYGFSN